MLIVACLMPLRLQSQSAGHWNPADRNLPWTSSMNPAVLSFQDARVALGLKMLHLGFVPDDAVGLHENRLNLSLPFSLPNYLAVGLDLRYLSAGIYSELGASLLLSREVWHRLALGVKMGLEHRSFSRNDFNLVDPDDPVLQKSLTTARLNVGLGLYWNPGNLTVGVGVDHLNRADVGLSTRASLPREISGAVGYRIGPFTPTLTFLNDGARSRLGFAIVAAPLSTGSFRLGFEQGRTVTLEAQFDLSRKDALRYGLDLPTRGTRGASGGSHELVYTHVFATEPDIGVPEILFSTRELQVLHKTVIRGMSQKLVPETLAASGELSAAHLTPVGHRENLLIIKAGRLSPHETEEGRLQRFRRLAAAIARTLDQRPGVKLVVHVDEGSAQDARLFKDLLLRHGVVRELHFARGEDGAPPDLSAFRPGFLTASRARPRLSSEELVVALRVEGWNRRTRRWQLRITDASGHIVKVYAGKGILPERLTWDWRDRDGALVEPGLYSFALRVQARSGKIKAAEVRMVRVTHIKRTVRLEFKEAPEMSGQESSQLQSLLRE